MKKGLIMDFSDIITYLQQTNNCSKSVKVLDAAKKLQDFIDSYYEIEPENKKDANMLLTSHLLASLQNH